MPQPNATLRRSSIQNSIAALQKRRIGIGALAAHSVDVPQNAVPAPILIELEDRAKAQTASICRGSVQDAVAAFDHPRHRVPRIARGGPETPQHRVTASILIELEHRPPAAEAAKKGRTTHNGVGGLF